ncbi:guanylyl cyclase inhibitory protein isoform X1 [Rhinoraja longicauda]
MGQTAVLPPRRKDTYALELHIWYRKFIEECPSGLITLHEFRRHFCDGTVGPGSSEYAEQIFRTLDDNRDDLVDYREYVTAVSLLIQGTAEEKLKWSFKLYDKDKDGAISRAEMLEIMQVGFQPIRTAWFNLETIYKMSLAASLTNVDLQTAEECTERMFTRLDKDRDAVISRREFVEGALGDAWVRAMLECNPSTVEVPPSARPRQQQDPSSDTATTGPQLRHGNNESSTQPGDKQTPS